MSLSRVGALDKVYHPAVSRAVETVRTAVVSVGKVILSKINMERVLFAEIRNILEGKQQRKELWSTMRAF